MGVCGSTLGSVKLSDEKKISGGIDTRPDSVKSEELSRIEMRGCRPVDWVIPIHISELALANMSRRDAP